MKRTKQQAKAVGKTKAYKQGKKTRRPAGGSAPDGKGGVPAPRKSEEEIRAREEAVVRAGKQKAKEANAIKAATKAKDSQDRRPGSVAIGSRKPQPRQSSSTRPVSLKPQAAQAKASPSATKEATPWYKSVDSYK